MSATFILFILGLFALIGYLRYAVDNQKPKYLLQPEVHVQKWMSENTWASRFSVFFAIFVFIFNLLAWAVYGLISLVDFGVFLFKWLWWAIMWIWNEVLHPTVFAIVKLLWHYVIVSSWRLFQFAFTQLGPSFKLNTIWFSFRELLKLFGMGALYVILVMMTSNPFWTVIGSFVLFFFFQFVVFYSVAYLQAGKYSRMDVFPSLRITSTWFFMSGVAALFLYFLQQHSADYIVSALGVSFSQVFLPVAILVGIAILFSSFYLPAFVVNDESEFRILGFLRALLIRLPKLLFALPFKLIGLVIAGVIPFVLVTFLGLGIQTVTEKSPQDWTKEISSMGRHLPGIRQSNENILTLSSEKAYIERQRDSISSVYTLEIRYATSSIMSESERQSRLEELIGQRDELLAQKQHQLSSVTTMISRLEENSKRHLRELIGQIFALLGFVLLASVAFSTIWSYLLNFHFDLYSFQQDGRHYWEVLLQGIREKNPNQPLLGIFSFVLIVVALQILLYILLS